jgi:pimeloyl-ACP methyl ester carboxylesterase
MDMPTQLKPALWGAFIGAVAVAVVGFSWGGWVTGSTAEATAKRQSSLAVVNALTPICVDKFRQQANVPASVAELKAVSSWQQGAFIEKGGWATMPGSTSPDSSVAKACAEIVGNPKL